MSISSALAKTASTVTSFGLNMARAMFGLSTAPTSSTRVRSSNLSNTVDDDSLSSATQVLGLIYRLMVRAREEEILHREEELTQLQKKQSDYDRRNNEIIEALTVKKIPVKKPAKKREVEPTKPTKKEPVKTTEKVTPKEAPKPTAEKAPTTPPTKAAPRAPRAPVAAGKGAAGAVSAGAGVIASITAGLVAAGITNAYAQKAILANVGKETGFKPRDENLAAYANTSNERIREVFTSRTQNYSDAQLNEIKKNPVSFGEMVYGKSTKIGQSMGNTQDGDGYKYRGRGSIQLTGKNNYKAYSAIVKQDLVSNPDLVNEPSIDAAIVAAFVKTGVGSNKINSFTDQQTANRAVTQAIGGSKLNLDVGVGAKILSKVDEYSSALSVPTTQIDNSQLIGNKIDTSSKENLQLKSTLKEKQSQSVNITSVSPQSQESLERNVPDKVDDGNIYQKKSKR